MKKIDELKASLREKADRLGELSQVRELSDAQKAEVTQLEREYKNISRQLEVEIREAQAAALAKPAPEKSKGEQLREVLNRFLASLPQKNRMIFVRRYWYTDSAADIAAAYDMNENAVNALLFRMRRKLKQQLHGAGIDV